MWTVANWSHCSLAPTVQERVTVAKLMPRPRFHVSTGSCAAEAGASHLSKMYLKAMKAKASGRVQTRSRGWGKTLWSPSVFRSRQCRSGGSQKSSLHSHSFSTASILWGQRGDGGDDAGTLFTHRCCIHVSVGQQPGTMEDTQWPVFCYPALKCKSSSRGSGWKKIIS